MEEYRVKVGLKYTDEEGLKWRVISISAFACAVIRLNISKTEFKIISPYDIVNSITSGIWIEDTEQQAMCFDYNELSEKLKADFELKRNFIREFRDMYSPSYSEFISSHFKPEFVNLYNRYGFSKTLALRLVRRWFQSGMQDGSLLDPRKFPSADSETGEVSQRRSYKTKPGRKTSESQGIIVNDDVLKTFEYGRNLWLKQRLVSMKEAYARMLYKFYTVTSGTSVVLVAQDMRPTYNQFRYYLSTHVSFEQREKAKTSNAEYRNNMRLLMSSPREDGLFPGYVLEADALEVDINIVSMYDKQQNIGRPILYMLTDIFSHAIVAFYVGLNNNSTIGLTSLMLNLFDNKERLMQEKGIVADLSKWPSEFIPREIRCDRGSDFASNIFGEICQNLNITRTLETGAMGSMKGLIEQSFRLFHQDISPEFENLGFMQRRYDCQYAREACLTLDDMFKLIVMFIIKHNSNYVEKFKLTPEMMSAGVAKTPIAIWNYGAEYIGRADEINGVNYTNCIYNLLVEDTAIVSREGVKYRGLYYTNRSDSELMDRMKISKINAGKRNTDGTLVNSMKVRFDPRSVNNLFYEKNGKVNSLEIISFKSGGIKDISWDEYKDYSDSEKSLDKSGKESNLNNRIQRIAITQSIAESAVTDTLAYTKNIEQNRKNERFIVNFDNRVSKRLLPEDEKEQEKKEPVEPVSDSAAVRPAPSKKKAQLKDCGPAPSKKAKKTEALVEAPVEKVKSEEEQFSIFSSDCPLDLMDF